MWSDNTPLSTLFKCVCYGLRLYIGEYLSLDRYIVTIVSNVLVIVYRIDASKTWMYYNANKSATAIISGY